jgi:hypothetical protein
VAVAERPNGVVTTALDVGYLLIEPLAQEKGSHHGGSATASVGAPLGDWVSVGLALHGVLMTHPDDQMGADDSGTGFPVLAVRVLDTRQALSYGIELEGVFPGRDAPSIDFAATTLRATGMATYAPVGSSWAYAVNLGYQLDNSARAAPPIVTLRQGDRTALGASSFDAVLVGLSAAYAHGPWLLFGGLSADISYGAPRPATSPSRVEIGARYAAMESLQLELRSRVGLSARPGFDSEHYQAFEPRFALFFGPRVTWGAPDASPTPPVVTRAEPTVKPVLPPVIEPEVTVVHEVVGRVTDEAGAPLAQVAITAKSGDWSQKVETGVDGSYRLTSVPVGDVQLMVQTVDYEPAAAQVRVAKEAAQVMVPPIELEVQVLGAQVEGVVRGFDGRIPQATVTLTPGDRTCVTDAEGKFKLDVGPGDYRVTVSAPGYDSQTRNVTVQKQGVVIVNVDLRTR